MGATYISIDSTNPATLFGFGTWTRIEGQFLLGATDNATGSGASYVAGATGGAATVTLTSAQSGLPAHNHGTTITQPAFTTPKFTHTITQPAFTTPKFTHSITQPVLNNGGAHTHDIVSSENTNSKLYPANYSYSSSDGHVSNWDSRYTTANN